MQASSVSTLYDAAEQSAQMLVEDILDIEEMCGAPVSPSCNTCEVAEVKTLEQKAAEFILQSRENQVGLRESSLGAVHTIYNWFVSLDARPSLLPRVAIASYQYLFFSRLRLVTADSPRDYYNAKSSLWERLNIAMSDYSRDFRAEGYTSHIGRAARCLFELHLESSDLTGGATLAATCLQHLQNCHGCSKSGRRIWAFMQKAKASGCVETACTVSLSALVDIVPAGSTTLTRPLSDEPLSSPPAPQPTSLPVGSRGPVLAAIPLTDADAALQAAVPQQPSLGPVLAAIPLTDADAALQAAVPQQPSLVHIPSVPPAMTPKWQLKTTFDNQIDFQWRASVRAAGLRPKRTALMKRRRFNLFDVEYHRIQLTGTGMSPTPCPACPDSHTSLFLRFLRLPSPLPSFFVFLPLLLPLLRPQSANINFFSITRRQLSKAEHLLHCEQSYEPKTRMGSKRGSNLCNRHASTRTHTLSLSRTQVHTHARTRARTHTQHTHTQMFDLC